MRMVLVMLKNFYIKSVNVEEIWITEDWFYVAAYGNFGDGGNATNGDFCGC